MLCTLGIHCNSSVSRTSECSLIVTLPHDHCSIFNALFLVYAIIQIFEIRHIVAETTLLTSDGISHIPVGFLTTILPVIISVAELAYIALGWKIYNEFGWKVYKFLGADRKIKKMFTSYQIFQCLVKFDVFFWVGFSVQFIWLVLLQKSNWEYYITCAALPVSLILLVEGHLAARHENNWMMVTFMSGCVGAMVYFIYKVSAIFQHVYATTLTRLPLARRSHKIQQHSAVCFYSQITHYFL
jgi:hypothetical protein